MLEAAQRDRCSLLHTLGFFGWVAVRQQTGPACYSRAVYVVMIARLRRGRGKRWVGMCMWLTSLGECFW
jgi:hypothetical protein